MQARPKAAAASIHMKVSVCLALKTPKFQNLMLGFEAEFHS